MDDYIGIKTLHLLRDVGRGICVTIVSDNARGGLRMSDLEDFRRECPDVRVSFIRSDGASHDRFIVLDHGTEMERVFHCGTSSKDAGYRMTAVTEFTDADVKAAFSSRLSRMLENPPLKLL